MPGLSLEEFISVVYFFDILDTHPESESLQVPVIVREVFVQLPLPPLDTQVGGVLST